jgi:predicted ATPase
MQHGLAAHQATGAAAFRPYFLALLAEGYGQAGQAAEGLHVLDEALAAAHQHAEHFYTAELYRLQGELLLQSGGQPRISRVSVPHAEKAEACFQQALGIARQQQARSLELRAAVSLSRLWQQQGKRAAARALLTPVYAWFAEGFDTADLHLAQTLLTALRA